jgi:hypothetical protein
LQGDANEALSVVPFSDTIGLTDPKNAHSMEEVLQSRGLVGENDPTRWEARDFLVPALEIAADPGTYLSFGASALTKAGKFAKAAGVLPKGHRAMIEGFHALEPELLAAGRSAEEIAHMARAGSRIAPTALVDAAHAAGTPIKAGEPLAGLLGLGSPFGDPLVTLGHGKPSQAIAGAFDAAKEGIKYAPGVRTLRQWFDTNAGRSADRIGQEAWEAAGRPAKESAEEAIARWEYDARRRLEPLVRSAPKGGELEMLRLMRQEAEHVAEAGDPATWAASFAKRHGAGLVPGVADPKAVMAHVEQHWDALKQIGTEAHGMNKDWRAELVRLGVNAKDLSDEQVEYMMRQALAVPGNSAGGGVDARRLFPTAGPSSARRKDILRDIPGGTEQINLWAVDPRLSGENPALLKPKAARRELYQQMTQRLLDEGLPFPALNEAMQGQYASKARGLSRWLRGLDPIHAEAKVPFFNPDLIADQTMRGGRQAQLVGAVNALYHGAGGYATPIAQLRGSGKPFVRLDQFLDQAGLRTTRPYAPLTNYELTAIKGGGLAGADEARALIRSAGNDPAAAAKLAAAGLGPMLETKLMQRGFEGGAVRLYENLAHLGVPLQDFSTGATSPLATLARYGLTQAQADALTRFAKGWVSPHEMKDFLPFLNSWQNLFKNLAYPLWPASHVRNLVSAVYNNFIHGTPFSAYGDAIRLMRGQGIEDAAKYAALHPNWSKMTPAQRGDLLNQLAYAHAKVYQGIGGSRELVGRHGLAPAAEKIAAGERITPFLPGSDRVGPTGSVVGDTANLVLKEGLWDALAKPGARNVLGQAGVFGKQQDTWAPLVAGRMLGTNLEDSVRLANFLGGLQQGMAPDVAGRLTRAIHFDYTDLTPFERTVMRKLVPFYTFARKNLPAQIEMLASQPGKILPAIRALTNVDDRSEYVPDYLASGVAIPWGTGIDPETGRPTQKFLNKVGLPFEEALDRFRFRNYQTPTGGTVSLPSFSGTALAFLGTASPYLKGPLEYATDTQFHTGRRLSDLRPTGLGALGGVLPEEIAQALTQITANSPITRFGSTADKLIDPRKTALEKAQNLLTGFKVTDVDLERARAVEAMRELREILKLQPGIARFENLYHRPGSGALAPEVVKLMQLYTGMKSEAKDAAKEQEIRRKMAGMGIGLGR